MRHERRIHDRKERFRPGQRKRPCSCRFSRCHNHCLHCNSFPCLGLYIQFFTVRIVARPGLFFPLDIIRHGGGESPEEPTACEDGGDSTKKGPQDQRRFRKALLKQYLSIAGQEPCHGICHV